MKNHPHLHLIASGSNRPDLESQVLAAVSAGVPWLQLRCKEMDLPAVLELAQWTSELCREHGIRFTLNDHPELALQVGAWGAHLGKADLSPLVVRERWGTQLNLGATVNTLEDAERVASWPTGTVQYVGVGPWRFTTTKKALAPVLSPAVFQAILTVLSEIPAWAIGGLRLDDLPAVHELGFAGIAVSGAIYGAENIQETAQKWMNSAEKQWLFRSSQP